MHQNDSNNNSNPFFEGITNTDLFLNIISNFQFFNFEIVPDNNSFGIFRSQTINEDLESNKK